MKKTAVAAATIFLSVKASAVPIQIDFSTLTPGTVVTDQLAGLTLSLISAPIAGPLVVNPGSTQTAGSGGNLIAPTPNTSPVCCVEPFFDIRFVFADTLDFFSILALDAEDAETYTLNAFLDGAQVFPSFTTAVIGSFSIPTSVGPIRSNVLGAIGGTVLFNEVLVDLGSSGPEVWDDVSYNVVSVPEPGTLGLLLTGLSAVLIRRRKRR